MNALEMHASWQQPRDATLPCLGDGFCLVLLVLMPPEAEAQSRRNAQQQGPPRHFRPVRRKQLNDQ